MSSRERTRPELPSSVDVGALSDVLGINPRNVRDFASRGIIKPAPQRGRFLFVESVQSYTRHLREQAAGRATATGLNLADERALAERAERHIREIKLAQLKSELVALAEIEPAWANMAKKIRASFLAIPGKLRARIPHMTAHDGETARDVCREQLEALCEDLSDGSVLGADPEPLKKAK